MVYLVTRFGSSGTCDTVALHWTVITQTIWGLPLNSPHTCRNKRSLSRLFLCFPNSVGFWLFSSYTQSLILAEMRPAELFFQMHLLAEHSEAGKSSTHPVVTCQSPQKWISRAIHADPSSSRYWKILQKYARPSALEQCTETHGCIGFRP